MNKIKNFLVFVFIITFALLPILGNVSKVEAASGGFLANPNWVSSGGIDYNSIGVPGVFGAMFATGTDAAHQTWVTSENTQVSFLDGSQDLYLVLIDYKEGETIKFSVTQFISLSEQDLRTYLDAFVAATGPAIEVDSYNLYYSSVPVWVANGPYQNYTWNPLALPPGATVNSTTNLGSALLKSFVVDSTGDESDAHTGDGNCATEAGYCTLRAAIEESNSTSSNFLAQITFTSDLGTIYPDSELPQFYGGRTIIDGGGTQVVDGTNSGDVNGFTVNAPDADVTITGMEIQNFQGDGIAFWYSTNAQILSNNVHNNKIGVGIGSHNNVVVVSENNVVDNLGRGIYLNGASGVIVHDNNISNNADYGISIGDISNSNMINENTISDNENYGIYLDQGTSSSNIISGNILDGNTEIGIAINNAGDDNTITLNTILNHTISGIYINKSDGNTVESNIVHDNYGNGIFINSSNNNTIDSNTVSGNGVNENGYWLAGVSIMKYGDTSYNGVGVEMGDDSITNMEKIVYSSDMQNLFSVVLEGNNIINSEIEAAAESEGGFDIGLIRWPTEEGTTIALTGVFSHNMIQKFIPGAEETLANWELIMGAYGGSAEALLQNVLTKNGDTWTYNGITNGEHGVIVETDGEAVTLAEGAENPSLTHSAYGPYSGIVLDGTSSSNTIDNNTLTDNANGISFTGLSNNNTMTDGSITSYLYNAITDTTDKTNTLNSVDFDRTKVQRTSGTLIILPLKPIQITDLVVTPGDGQVTLSWTIPNDGGEPIVDYIIGYRISGTEEDGTFVEHDPFTGNTFTITGLTNGVTYDVGVVSLDENENKSEPVMTTVTPGVTSTSTHRSITGSYLPGYGTNLLPTDCLPGYLYSPSTGKACGTTSAPTTPKFTFTKNLKYLQIDNEVKELQKFLNTHGYQVSTTGAGSLGNETNYFGLRTKKAIIKFQLANSLIGDGIVGILTKAKINSLLN